MKKMKFLSSLAIVSAIVGSMSILAGCSCIKRSTISTIYDLTYTSSEKKYVSTKSFNVEPTSTVVCKIIVETDESSNAIIPQKFSLAEQTGGVLVPIKSITSVYIDKEIYEGAKLENNIVDLGDLSTKSLKKNSTITITIVSDNTALKKVKGVCDVVEAKYLDIVGNDAFDLKIQHDEGGGYGPGWNGTLEYSIDNKEWFPWDGSGEISASGSGEQYHIYLRGKNNSTFNGDYYTNFVFEGENNPQISLNGNIMTLLDCDDPSNVTMEDFCFAYLFQGCGNIISIPKLPATTLSSDCYMSMFQNCTGITELPNNLLPATSLSPSCYFNMFQNCTGITELPKDLLPATELAESCYNGMFWGCTGLKSIPEKLLPAENLTSNCYGNMFYGCTGLTQLPEKLLDAAKQLENYCYFQMFIGCTGLTTLPAGLLPATILASNCYEHMFDSCTGLESIPENLLRAEILAEACYSNMFEGCTGLTTLPKGLLPSTTLADKCYSGMFRECEKITSIPDLPTKTLDKDSCYRIMFEVCKALKVVETNNPDEAFMTIESKTGTNATSGMFQGCKIGSISTDPEAGKSYKVSA